MTNRQKYILNKDAYDIMATIRKNTGLCSVEVLDGLKRDMDYCKDHNFDCKDCWQEWLNEEADSRPSTALTQQQAMERLRNYETLEDKHWEECRQIALYSDELREAVELLMKCKKHLNVFCNGLLNIEIGKFLEKAERSRDFGGEGS